MRLKTIRIGNYKGFRDSGPIELGQHWTVVVGRNNAGKSALLEAFSFGTFVNKPHRDISRRADLPLVPLSTIEASVEVDAAELERTLLFHQTDVHIPVPRGERNAAERFFAEKFASGQRLTVSMRRDGNNNPNAPSPWSSKYPSHSLFANPNEQASIQVRSSPNRQRWITSGQLGSGDTLPTLVGLTIADGAYVFRAERRVSGTSPMQNNLSLQPDASNLPGALHYLASSAPRQFDRFMSLLKQVLPDIEAVTIPPLEGNTVQIRVWNSGYQEERSDLAIPLEECGTGIGQVMAILFIVVTAPSGRIIVIDEPNSFLHPGASRTLMALLSDRKEHQFILTTHSPEIISAVQPEKLVVVQWESNESRVTVSDGAEVASLKTAFDEVGVRLSDVFGYDAIAWVEGVTEAKCFPLLLKAAGRSLPPRTAFVPVVNTGDFEGPDAETIWRVYRNLSRSSPFMPQAVSISFDREGKSEAKRAELTKMSENLITFLPRCTYENYLLHAEAIAALLHHLDPGNRSTAKDIQQWMNTHHEEKRYYPDKRGSGEHWTSTINGSQFVHGLVGDLTNNTQNFDGNKVAYSLFMTQWLIENDKSHLNELIAYVATLVPSNVK